MWFIIDGRFLPGDMNPELQRVAQAQKSSSEFHQIWSLYCASDLTDFLILTICSKRNIDSREKLNVGYGSS